MPGTIRHGRLEHFQEVDEGSRYGEADPIAKRRSSKHEDKALAPWEPLEALLSRRTRVLITAVPQRDGILPHGDLPNRCARTRIVH
jgi:hypothetical protein